MTSEQIFNECVKIYENLNDNNKETEAKEKLFYLLDKIQDKALYPPILNHLIRQFGLYPYMNQDTSILEDKFLLECFKANIGEDEPKVLHREQSRVLKRLLDNNNESLILSAPTSFGKSFIIDALIAMKKPKNILIIVPTISLLDETRRRLVRKFTPNYNLITTSGATPKENNIFILTQERVLEYLDFIKANRIDLFIVDEFYKIVGDTRSDILQNAIKQVSSYSKQSYYLCPNIKQFDEKSSKYQFLKNIEKVLIDFNTVALKTHDLSHKKEKKEHILKNILNENKNQKTMIYIKSKSESKKVCKNIKNYINATDNQLKSFSNWLKKHYWQDWDFAECLANGIGQHNAAMHRFIQQLQVKLFSENEHMNIMATTTSLIEGVNTATKNIVIWNDSVARDKDKLTSMQYKNIIGRCGRMFKYFVGNVYLLESNKETLKNEQETMEIIPQEEFLYRNDLETFNTKTKIEENLKNVLNDKNKFYQIMSKMKNYSILMDLDNILTIVENAELFEKSIEYLNSDVPDEWGFIKKKEIREIVFKILNEKSRNAYFKIIDYGKHNYDGVKQTINNISKQERYKINISQYFDIEKAISFDIASFFNDLNQIMQILYPEKEIDISSFVTKLSNAFLPSVVYTLEEFGLPRIISKKLHQCGFIDFENNDLTIEQALSKFKEHTADDIINILKEKNLYDNFEDYILNYFYEGLG
ncbi:TPA: DEAD/DEAH box helicase [Campylobacter lari]|uniref:DEAD/DEAH box helicase n=3 Tax=Campylobacter lari TaxID=201 RepID=UPI0008B8E075|nr:DEAD/DEAH box helicase [Campylobacter lari]EAH5177734.1 DEAD/DEAH box helicase [Campylobacter lari]EAH7838083.1 DEAD/DEAH box helicase [Campylobacter lari]EAI2016279.1 DEAD/DEAH box helicase [Campylobacter lari]EAI2082373.1 DEAD/DEAH box helicase [Campylobacter lari]EAI2315520.1 DEAD/DEAH box helicase [Campylobacter lari]